MDSPRHRGNSLAGRREAVEREGRDRRGRAHARRSGHEVWGERNCSEVAWSAFSGLIPQDPALWNEKLVRATSRARLVSPKALRFIINLQHHKLFRNLSVIPRDFFSCGSLEQKRVRSVVRRVYIKASRLGRAGSAVCCVMSSIAFAKSKIRCGMQAIFPSCDFAQMNGISIPFENPDPQGARALRNIDNLQFVAPNLDAPRL